MPHTATLRERAQRLLLRAILGTPTRRLVRGPPKVNDRGDVLDPAVQVLCRLSRLQPVEVASGTVEAARRGIVSSVRVVEGPLREVRTEDLVAGEVPARLYHPGGDGGRPLPLLVYAHGGGWVTGDLRSHDGLCRRLARDGRQAVLALQYRLAPEHRFPVGLGDVVSAFRWARDHAARLGADPARVAIGGDSAGGNLAAAACLVLRDRELAQPAFQLLVYPGCDLRRLTASYRALGEGYLLTGAAIDWYVAHYGADPLDPRASVALEPDLRGLAPAIVATAGFDPLRDEGESYARRLAEAGVRVDLRPFPSLVHGFVHLDGVVPAADRAVGALALACEAAWYVGHREA